MVIEEISDREKTWSEEKHSIIPLSDLNLPGIPQLVEAKKTKMSLMDTLGWQVDTFEKREPHLRDCLYQICQWVNLWRTFLMAN